LPLGDFLARFAALTLEAAEELDDGLEYPRRSD
jgi:hypothetical protein